MSVILALIIKQTDRIFYCASDLKLATILVLVIKNKKRGCYYSNNAWFLLTQINLFETDLSSHTHQ